MQTSARQAALEILERCRRDRAWSGAGIDSVIKKYGFDRRDGALTSQLCLGVLENSRLCDFYISAYSPSKLEPKVRDILRLGVYQLLFLDKIPARAAVNECVALCKECGYGRASGLVNAVLRRVSDNRDALPEIPCQGTAKYLAVKYSHPDWLCEYMVRRCGFDFTEQYLKCNNSPSRLTIQVNTLKVPASDYVRALDRSDVLYTAAENLEGCLSLESGNALSLPGFDEGLFYVQDRAARIAVEAAAPKSGMRIMDACASPGGKTFAACIAMQNQGGILSCDIHEKKLNLVKSGAKRLGLDIIDTRAMDARIPEETFESAFDIVIADVPCSGFGVISKKPEIRDKTPEEISALPEIQRAILDNLSSYVRPGGILLYSTCTLIREENENVVEGFLKSHGDFCAEGFCAGGINAPDGIYTFWPNVDGTDGFFIAKLRRA